MRREERRALIERLKQEEKAPFSGWDFSHIASRMSTTPLPWSFESLAREALRTSRVALDLGTGGGERLSTEVGCAAGRVFATEGLVANVPVARARLEPLGVGVIASTPSRLPFRDACFDLVLSDKTGFNASEVARVLLPAGRLLTEHIDVNVDAELRGIFGQPSQTKPGRGGELADRCKSAGLAIEHMETAVSERSFNDVGALVYWLRAVPWLVPGFSVESYVEPLLALQERLEREGRLAFSRRMCLLIARRPA